MSNRVFCDISISADGYVAGPGQTHHPRDPLPMQGGTTFTFVTDGIDSALDQPLHLEILAVRAASLTTHISYRVLH